jgi:hypothetical protein
MRSMPVSFNRNHDFKRHKRIHLAVRPFPCNHCDKSFSRKDALKVRRPSIRTLNIAHDDIASYPCKGVWEACCRWPNEQPQVGCQTPKSCPSQIRFSRFGQANARPLNDNIRGALGFRCSRHSRFNRLRSIHIIAGPL